MCVLSHTGPTSIHSIGEDLQGYFSAPTGMPVVWNCDLNSCCTTMCTIIMAVALRFGCEDVQRVVTTQVAVRRTRSDLSPPSGA